jgi:hypothetical protein
MLGFQSKNKLIPLLISLGFHIALILALWPLFERKPLRSGSEGITIETISMRRTRVIRRPMYREVDRRQDISPQVTTRKMEGPEAKRIENLAPDLRFGLDQVAMADQISYESSWIAPDSEEKGRTRSQIELQGPRRPQLKSPAMKRFGDGNLQGEEIGPPVIDAGGTLLRIADHLIEGNRSGKLDLIFLIDSSGTMRPYILRVARELSSLADRIGSADIDLAIGVVAFRIVDREKILEISEPSTDISLVKKRLLSIRCIGDERALDAIAETYRSLKTRKSSEQMILLVTDEKMKGRVTIDEIAQLAERRKSRIYILGVDDPQQLTLADRTGGVWYKLPSSEDEMVTW